MHTQGPWTVGHQNLEPDSWFHRIFYSDNRGIYEVATIDKRKRPQADANANLIAAAPDLLVALETMLSHTLATDNAPPHIVAARAAIAKARHGLMDYSAYQVTIKTDCSYYGEDATPEEATETVRDLADKISKRFPEINIRYCPMIGANPMDKTSGPDRDVCNEINTYVEDLEYFV
jgi:hypothetical protein